MKERNQNNKKRQIRKGGNQKTRRGKIRRGENKIALVVVGKSTSLSRMPEAIETVHQPTLVDQP